MTFSRYWLLRISQCIILLLLAINENYAIKEQLVKSPLHFNSSEMGVDFEYFDNEIASSEVSVTSHPENSSHINSLQEYEFATSPEEVNINYFSEINKTADKNKLQPSYYNIIVNKKPVNNKKSQQLFCECSEYTQLATKKNYSSSSNHNINTKQRADIVDRYRFAEKSRIAVKTNLLFDVASALNIEIEAPIGKRWSVAGEYIFPWWLWEDKQYCLQVLSGNLEGRYWFGDRNVKAQLTGWFAGLYAGGGYYDLEWGDKGYQGEFFIASGLSGGYVHSISKNGKLRMEYSLGIGYLQTKYREYVPQKGIDDKWHLIHQANGKYSWFGPTKAKVSLVWMIDLGFLKKKGGSR